MSGYFFKSFFLAVFLFFLLTGSSIAAMVSISGKIVNMRSGPGKNFPVLYKLGEGFPLKRLRRKGNWVKVKDFENDVGWVHKSLLDSTPHLIVKRKSVNIRKGPGLSNPVIGVAEYGVVLKTLELRGGLKGWVKVRHESGLVGWIKRRLLWGW